MGNSSSGHSLGHLGLKLDKTHRGSCIGISDVSGTSDLEGGLNRDPRIGKEIKSVNKLKRDVLEAAAVSAMVSDVTGFRLEFEVIGHQTSLIWRMTSFIKLIQVFPNASAPPKITSIRGFYGLFFLLKELHQYEDLNAGKENVGPNINSDILETRTDCDEEEEDDDVEDINGNLNNKEETPKYEFIEDEIPECPICMDCNIQIVPSCGHGLCSSCYYEWKEKDAHCPTCRVKDNNEGQWIIPIIDDIPSTDQHVNQLMQSIHTCIQSLPRLETQWEKQQRLQRERFLQQRLSRSTSSERSQQLSTSRRRSSDGVAAFLQPYDPNQIYSDDDDEEEENNNDENYDGFATDYLQSSSVLSDMPASFLEEQAHLQLALSLSVQL